MAGDNLEREITTPEDIHKLCDDLRAGARLLHDGLQATLAEFRPALINGLIERGHADGTPMSKMEARRIAGKVLRGWEDAVAGFNAASVGGPATWRQYQRLVAQPMRRRHAGGKVFHIPEKKGA